MVLEAILPSFYVIVKLWISSRHTRCEVPTVSALVDVISSINASSISNDVVPWVGSTKAEGSRTPSNESLGTRDRQGEDEGDSGDRQRTKSQAIGRLYIMSDLNMYIR